MEQNFSLFNVFVYIFEYASKSDGVFIIINYDDDSKQWFQFDKNSSIYSHASVLSHPKMNKKKV